MFWNSRRSSLKEPLKKWIFQFNLFAKATQLNEEEALLLFDEHALVWYQYLPEEMKANKDTLTSTLFKIMELQMRTDY